jgi:hypothetical protein
MIFFSVFSSVLLKELGVQWVMGLLSSIEKPPVMKLTTHLHDEPSLTFRNPASYI